MKLFRSVLFWMHLIAGLISGVSIAIMCFTGTTLAFEQELVEWSERDARQVAVPADAQRLSFQELQGKLREAQPEFRPASVTINNRPDSAITYSAGRDGGYYVNPYTGEVRQPASSKMHDFLHVMEDWHRVLGRAGDSRATGKLINGVCNIAFCVLAITGLYLWWPRSLTWRGFRAVSLFNWKLSGKARDFNWHNVIGFWSAPVLIVLTLTAIPISFRWGGNLIYKLAGEEVPAQGGPGGPGAAAAPAVEVKRPSPDARPLTYDVIVAKVQQNFPQWTQISLRSGGGFQRGGPGQRPAGAGANAGSAQSPAPATAAPSTSAVDAPARGAEAPRGEDAPRGERRGGEGRGEGGGGAGRAAPQPLTVTIREAGSWPRTATTTLTLNPFTGDELKREGFRDLSPARQIRSWTRFLHTGQALGVVGQFVAGLACLGGCFLVYTGFALSWRRFFGKKQKSPPAAKRATAVPQESRA